jgi:NhaP-type Na+/H+ or K+/H+ antiporter
VTPSLIAIAFVVAGWSIFGKGLQQRWHLTAPIVLVLAGVAVGLTTRSVLASTLNTEVAQRVAEFILAMLLFLDATEVRGGFLGRDPRSAFRLLFIGLPLSVALLVLLGRWLLPELSWAVLVVITCAAAPIDFASAPSILRDERIPERVRSLLKVEAGYGDGIISPVFICALAVAVGQPHRQTALDALTMAVPPVIEALVVGAVIGGALALLTNAAERRDAMAEQSKRLLIIAAPILSYGVSVGIGGNGFISAFVAGIAMNTLRRSETFRQQLASADDVGFVLAAVMWFVFGCAAVLAFANGVPWRIAAFGLLALTIGRLAPILLSTMGSRLTWPDRLAIGCLGPRGTPSIVFGLLAFNMLGGEPADSTILTVVIVVLGSIVLHGAGSPAMARLYPQSENVETKTESAR